MPTVEEFWQFKSELGEELKTLKTPCKDCAIETGFYLPLAKSLKTQSEQMQNKVAARWNCHNNCNRGCAGIFNYLKK